MAKTKRIFIVADVGTKSIKMFLNQIPKLAKSKGYKKQRHTHRFEIPQPFWNRRLLKEE